MYVLALQRSLIISVTLTMTWFSEKMPISTRCLDGFTPNLHKQFWMVSNNHAAINIGHFLSYHRFFSLFSWNFIAWDSPSKQKVLSHEIYFGQKFTRNVKNGSECLKLIWNGTFAIYSTQPLWLWSRIGSKVKISPYIQASNISSA